MKTKGNITIRRVLGSVMMILLILFMSCHKENEPKPSPAPSGGNTEPQPGDVVQNAVVDVDGKIALLYTHTPPIGHGLWPYVVFVIELFLTCKVFSVYFFILA